MPMKKIILKYMGIMAAFTMVFTALLGGTYLLTQHNIKENERQAKIALLKQVLPTQLYDNDLLTAAKTQEGLALLGGGQKTIYPATLHGKPSAVVLEATAPDGYAGNINLLIALNLQGEVLGVRVVSHKETPGLGDYIDAAKSDWINIFTGKSLQNPSENGWAVQKDGGIFSHQAGATITPRAVIKAVHKALQYYQENQTHIFKP